MKKTLKYVLLVVGGVMLVVVAAATYVLLTFNPNDYKPQIIKAVKDSKHRDLKLEGDIKLSVFPSIGVSVSRISLSEPRSEREFASVESARVSLALLPLLSRRVVVDEVALSGVKAELIKHKDGKLNIDDLVSGEAPTEEAKAAPASAAPPVKFDIASVSVDKTVLTYRDETTGAQYSAKDLHVKTGRIANGVPSPTELSVTLQGNQPKVDLAVQLSAVLTLDLEKKLYGAEDFDLEAKGSAAGIRNLNLKANGDASANLETQEFGAKKLVARVSGTQDNNNFEAKLDAPALSLTKDRYSAEKVALDAKADGPLGNLAAILTLPGVEGNAQAFKISALTLDADLKQPEQAFKVKLSTPVSGSLESLQFSMPKLTLAMTATGDKLPNKSISSELTGNVELNAKKQTVAVNLAGGLLQSKIKADVAVANFSHPAIRFNADVDQFDADLYLPKKAESAPPARGGKEAAPEQPFDLSGLRSLNLDGSLRVGALKVANIKSSQLRVDVKARDGKVNVEPLSVNLYQGSAKLSASVNAVPGTPAFAVSGNLTGVNVGPLAKDAANLDLVEGRGNIALNLTTRGNLVSALKKGLNGTASVNLADGAIKGVNLQKLVQGVQSLGKSTKAETLGLNKDEKTPFSEFKASFKVVNGVAHNDDLSVKAPLLHVTGNGDIDIGNESLNYTAKATVSKTEGGGTATLPVHLTGPFADLKYTVDYGALATSIAKQKVEAKKEQVKEEAKAKAKEKLKEGLKGLFK